MNDTDEDLATLDQQFRSTGLPSEVLALLQLQPDPAANELVLRDLRGHGKYVAIEKQNFPWVLDCCRQVGNLLLAGAIPAWAPGAIADLTIQLIDFRNQSIELSGEEGLVLLELKKSDGLSLTQLADELGFDEPRTQAIVTSLQNKKRRDEVPARLVSCDAQGALDCSKRVSASVIRVKLLSRLHRAILP